MRTTTFERKYGPVDSFSAHN